jgi:hypothetical protein
VNCHERALATHKKIKAQFRPYPLSIIYYPVPSLPSLHYSKLRALNDRRTPPFVCRSGGFSRQRLQLFKGFNSLFTICASSPPTRNQKPLPRGMGVPPMWSTRMDSHRSLLDSQELNFSRYFGPLLLRRLTRFACRLLIATVAVGSSFESHMSR